MKFICEMKLEKFEAWSGAKKTLARIIDEGKCAALEFILEDLYPDGITETQLNDLLWFEPEVVYEWLDIKNDDE